MNLINMKTGARVCSSSSKHNELLERYKADDEDFRKATTLEYELAGLLFRYGCDAVQIAVNDLIKEAAERAS